MSTGDLLPSSTSSRLPPCDNSHCARAVGFSSALESCRTFHVRCPSDETESDLKILVENGLADKFDRREKNDRKVLLGPLLFR